MDYLTKIAKTYLLDDNRWNNENFPAIIFDLSHKPDEWKEKEIKELIHERTN